MSLFIYFEPTFLLSLSKFNAIWWLIFPKNSSICYKLQKNIFFSPSRTFINICRQAKCRTASKSISFQNKCWKIELFFIFLNFYFLTMKIRPFRDSGKVSRFKTELQSFESGCTVEWFSVKMPFFLFIFCECWFEWNFDSFIKSFLNRLI